MAGKGYDVYFDDQYISIYLCILFAIIQIGYSTRDSSQLYCTSTFLISYKKQLFDTEGFCKFTNKRDRVDRIPNRRASARVATSVTIRTI